MALHWPHSVLINPASIADTMHWVHSLIEKKLLAVLVDQRSVDMPPLNVLYSSNIAAKTVKSWGDLSELVAMG